MSMTFADVAKGPHGPALGAVGLTAAGPLLHLRFGAEAAAQIKTGARACLRGALDTEHFFESLEAFDAKDGSVDAGYFVEQVVLPEITTSLQIWIAFFWGACRSKYHDEVEAVFEAELGLPLSQLLAGWAQPDWACALGSAIAEGEAIGPDEFDLTVLDDLLPTNPIVDRCYPVAQALVELAKVRHIRALLDQLPPDSRQRIEAILAAVGQAQRGHAA